MSETNGKRRQPNRLDRAKFVKVFMASQERASEFQSSKPTMQEASETLTTMVGFTVSIDTVKELCRTTGVKWSSKRPSASKGSSYPNGRDMLRNIAKAVAMLYEKFEEPMPQGLQSALAKLDSRQRDEEDASLPSSK